MIKQKLSVSADVKTDIEFGDVKQEKFYPQAKALFWNNECNFSCRLDVDPDSGEYRTEDGNVIWESKSYKCSMHDGTMRVTVKTPLESDRVPFSIQSKGLAFYIQDPDVIYAEFPDANIPENVKYGYAVYHESKSGNRATRSGVVEYKTGQAFILYRPQVTDSKGLKAWCMYDLDLKNGRMDIVIPQDFLVNCVYPIEV